MATGSLQDSRGFIVMPPRIFPLSPNLDNYAYLLKDDIGIWLKNTLIVTISTVLLSVFISATTGYSFAIFDFKFKKIIFTLFLIPMMIPRISLIIPLFVIVKNLKIPGTLMAVVLPNVFSPLGIYLARNYFQSIPKSILESARIDGASELKILKSIVIPVSKPIISALSLFSAIGALQDYIWQMLVLQKPFNQTLLVGLMKKTMARGTTEFNINPVGRSFAAGIILLLPLLIIFIIANKYFTESLGGAVKE